MRADVPSPNDLAFCGDRSTLPQGEGRYISERLRVNPPATAAP